MTVQKTTDRHSSEEWQRRTKEGQRYADEVRAERQTTAELLTGEKWLYEYQKLVINVRGWLSRGMTETAMREIDAMQVRWAEACNAENRHAGALRNYSNSPPHP